MRSRLTVGFELYGTEEGNAYPLVVECVYGRGEYTYTDIGLYLYIATDEGELGLLCEEGEAIGARVELMISHRGVIKPNGIHKCNHGVSLGRELVVDGVARLVVSCRYEHEIGVKTAKTIHHVGEAREAVEGCMHVVYREKRNGCRFLLGKKELNPQQ